MAKTIKITLAGQEYELPRLDVGQAEDLAGMWEQYETKDGAVVGPDGEPLKGKALVTYTVDMAQIVLRRAAPPIGDVRQLECDITELQNAFAEVLRFTQLSREPQPGNGPAGIRPAA